jgi:hypothetical protein
MICDSFINAGLNLFNPDFKWVTTSSILQGDPECHWMILPKSWSEPYDVGRLGAEKAVCIPRNIPKSVADDFTMQYLAELWVISTRGFVNHYGNKPVPILLSYMRHSGTSFGLRYLRSTPHGECSIDKIKECIGLGNKALQMKGDEASMIEGGFERNIIECPFKDAPQEICMQFESFCQGICEAIDPGYEFRYDRMMTCGDKTCYWMIKKKNQLTLADENKNAISESSLEILKKRLAKGDLTLDEYRELKKELLT